MTATKYAAEFNSEALWDLVQMILDVENKDYSKQLILCHFRV
jgi:hypothetical protein